MNIRGFSSVILSYLTILFVFVILLSPTIFLINEFAKGNPLPENENYEVKGTLRITNENFTHNGSLTVSSGGHLILNNVTIYFQRGPAVITQVCLFKIESGGKLEMYSSRIGSYPGTAHYLKMDFVIEGNAVIEDCEIFDVGSSYKNGFLIKNDNILIERSTIRGSSIQGLTINNSNPTIRNCTFTQNKDDGIYCIGSAPKLIDILSINNGGSGIYFGKSVNKIGEIYKCTTSSNKENGIVLSRAKSTIMDCVIEGNQRSGIDIFDLNASEMIISANYLKGNDFGVSIYGVDSLSITKNIFENNNKHIRIVSSSAITRENTFGVVEEFTVSIRSAKIYLYDGPIASEEYYVESSEVDIRIFRSLSITVEDENNNPIQNAQLEVFDNSNNRLLSRMSDANGMVTGDFKIASWVENTIQSNGPYTLSAYKETLGATEEINLDQISNKTIILTQLPDLEIIKLEIKPQNNIKKGVRQFELGVTIKNNGTSNSPETTLDSKVDGTLISVYNLTSIKPNEEKIISIPWEVSDQGFYDLQFKLDPNQRVPELLETNNILTKAVELHADVKVEKNDITFSPLNATEGSNIKVSFNVTNDGLWGAGPVTVTIFVNNRKIDSQTKEFMKGGETWQIKSNMKASGGDMNVKVQARFADEIDELDLANNQASTKYSATRTETPFSWWPIFIGLIIVVCLIIGLLGFMKYSKKRRAVEAKEFEESMRFTVETHVEYLRGRLFYTFILWNGTPHPISDIHIRPVLPAGTFTSDSESKSLTMLEVKAKEMIRFELRPLGECGSREIWGTVDFYDYDIKGRRSVQTDKKIAEVVCPIIHSEPIYPQDFNNLIQNLKVVEEVADKIPVSARKLFDIVCNTLRSKNMAPLPTNVQDTGSVFHGIGRFWAKGVKGINYGVSVEVVGGSDLARLILRVYSSSEKALVGFTQAILDAVQPQLPVREHVKSKLLLQVVEGDLVDGKTISISDTVVIKNKVGGQPN
jgi:hypothetical protein